MTQKVIPHAFSCSSIMLSESKITPFFLKPLFDGCSVDEARTIPSETYTLLE